MNNWKLIGTRCTFPFLSFTDIWEYCNHDIKLHGDIITLNDCSVLHLPKTISKGACCIFPSQVCPEFPHSQEIKSFWQLCICIIGKYQVANLKTNFVFYALCNTESPIEGFILILVDFLCISYQCMSSLWPPFWLCLSRFHPPFEGKPGCSMPLALTTTSTMILVLRYPSRSV